MNNESIFLPCVWREQVASTSPSCYSPKVIAPFGVTAEACNACSLRNHPPVDKDEMRDRAKVEAPVMENCHYAGLALRDEDGRPLTVPCDDG